MTEPHEASATPADYRLLLPEGWFRLALEEERRAASVEALVDRQLRGADHLAYLRPQLRAELMARAEESYRGGGIELYLSLQQAGALTIPASLLVTLLRPEPGRALPRLDDLAQELSAEAEPGREVSMEKTAAGRALRVRREIRTEEETREEAREETREEAREQYAFDSVTVDYQLDIPGGQGQLLLTFSTPLVQLADAMTELFDAIGGSLTWSAA
ncbi:hypothetical protein SLNWT_3859 [Streptomyces albus]|uniref:Uncharacterized protein n=1 Tax=Streptomyces albus (strain ATCC 21838 / DSM 41398 / FERM P-419 / JCM 4703 / NBRC 107858) TaxID=1081613 RepID=A0A0B5EY74_STRA4|nr:hypothetical protein SLNWT_3859 [Streptomyces albus]AOU78542.1 hypothetical protein SLNHY_3851 [Streptomyces albus]AYN34286.1 hypothetical protein DUI70_3786 [Streptomyces albus]